MAFNPLSYLKDIGSAIGSTFGLGAQGSYAASIYNATQPKQTTQQVPQQSSTTPQQNASYNPSASFDYNQYYKIPTASGYDIYSTNTNQKYSYSQLEPSFKAGLNTNLIQTRQPAPTNAFTLPQPTSGGFLQPGELLVGNENVIGASRIAQSSFGGPGSNTGFMSPTAAGSGLPGYKNLPTPTATQPEPIRGQDFWAQQYSGARNSFDVRKIDAERAAYEASLPVAPSTPDYGQFGGGVAEQGHGGGGAALPGSIGGGFRTISGFLSNLLPSEEQFNKKRSSIINKADNAFNNLFSVPGANAQGPGAPSGSYSDQFVSAQGIPPQTGPGSQPQQQGAFPGGSGFFTSGGLLTGFQQPTTAQSSLGFLPQMTNSQQSLLDLYLGDTSSKIPAFDSTSGTIPGQEFANAQTGFGDITKIAPTDTVSNVKGKIAANTQQVYQQMNQQNQQIASEVQSAAQNDALEQISNGQSVYYKNINPQTGQIDIFKLNPDKTVSHVLMDEFQQTFGGDASKIPDGATLDAELSKYTQENLKYLLDPVTNRPYTQEDFNLPPDNPLKTAIDAKTKEIDDLIKKYNIKDIPDIASERAKIAQEEGLPSLNAQKKTLTENINALIGQFDKLADQIRDDPDFSGKLKSRRLTFMDSEKQRALAGFQRQLGLVDDQIKIASDNIATKISDKFKNYELQINAVKTLQDERDKIVTKLEKATDDDRQQFNLLLTQFGSTGINYKDLTPEQKSYFQSLFSNPSYLSILEGMDFKTQKDKSLSLQLQSVLNRTPANVTVNIPGLTTPGGQSGRYVPRGTSGLSDVQADSLNTDMTSAADAIAMVQQSADNDAIKVSKINQILGRLRTGYASSSTSLGIINQQFGSASTVFSGVTKTGDQQRESTFQQALQQAQTQVDDKASGFFTSTKGAAKEVQGNLLLQYPDYSAQITKYFSEKYGI